jgi:outer membrane protein assembly factor BamB
MPVRVPAFLVVLVGGVLTAATPILAADNVPPALKTAAEWPQWRGADRTGMSPDIGLLKSWETTPPKLLWTAEGLGGGYASVSLTAGRIYTTGNLANGQAVLCLNAADGKLLWSQPITDDVPKHGHDGSRCTPSIDGERLYAIASSGRIVCLKTADGSLVWSRDFKADWGGRMMSGWGFSESPLVDGDWVLCTPGGAEAMIVALDKRTGQDVWKAAVPDLGQRGRDGAGYSSIVVSHGGGLKQYVQLVGRGVIGVRAADGKFLWSYNEVANPTANIPTPIATGDFVFCSTGYRDGGSALLKLSAAAGGVQAEPLYYHEANVLQNHHGQMILKDGHLYFGNKHNNGFPVCVELATGKTAWGGSERGPGNGSAAITYADGNLIFRYQSGEVALIEATPSAYKLKGAFKPAYVSSKPCWAQPVVIGGKLYLRDQEKLLCYDLRSL